MHLGTQLFAGTVVLASLALMAGTPQVPGAISTRWFAANLYEGVVGFTQWALVGTTTTTHLGDAGVRTMNDACRAEFPMSRMCSSKEVIETIPHYAFSDSQAAWVRPVREWHNGTSGGSVADFRDISGAFSGDSSGSCDGWRDDLTGARYGLAVSPEGRFDPRAHCSIPRPIACCALIQVPEPSQNSGLVMGIAALSLLGQRRESCRCQVRDDT